MRDVLVCPWESSALCFNYTCELLCIKCMTSQGSKFSSENETEVVLLKYEREQTLFGVLSLLGAFPHGSCSHQSAERRSWRIRGFLAPSRGQPGPKASSAEHFTHLAGLNKQLWKSAFDLCAFLPLIPYRHRFAKWCTDTWISLQAQGCWGPPEDLSPSQELDALWKKVNVF